MLTSVGTRSQARPGRAVATALVLLALPAACVGREERRPGPEPVYCYRTLADVTCRTLPDAGRQARLVGVYLRDPDDPTWPDYWLRRRTSPTRP